MGMGFVENIIKGFFENNIQDFNKDIKFVIKNFNKQDKYSDYRLENLKVKTEPIIVDDFNIKLSKNGESEVTKFKVNKTKRTYTFETHNSKSGLVGFCEVIFINNKLDKTNLYKTKDFCYSNLQLVIEASHEFTKDKKGKTIMIDRVKPTVEGFKHVADINGFFIIIDQVLYGIEEKMSKGIKE